MALRLLSTRVLPTYRPLIQRTLILRGYATKKYTSDHEWISVDNGVGTFGITDHAQKLLGDIVFVETPQVGDNIKQGENVGAIESVKAASDIYSPVSGEIVDVNVALGDDPTITNTSPEEEGWIAKIKMSDESELDELLDESAYKALCEGEDH